jgi:putative phage-type endonuclease
VTAVLVPTGSDAEWLDARRQGITASEIAIVMGLSPYSSPYALHHQKLGVLDGQEDNDAMALGRYLEAFVASRFADLYPEFTVAGDGRTLYAHPDRGWQLATPDRLVDCCPGHDEIGPPLAVLEAKTAASYDGWGDDGTDQIPVHYRCQVLWQMDVLGVQAGYVACLFLHSRKLRIYELTMDVAAEADLKLMRDEGWAFLKRLYVRNPPDVDWRPATTGTLKHLHPSVEDRSEFIPRELARRYRAACKAVKAAEQRRDLAANQIRARMGAARYAHGGTQPGMAQVIARRDVYDLPEKTITRKAATVDRLVAVKPKETP